MTTKKGATLTFGDVSENYAGMAKQGRLHDQGFSLEDFNRIMNMFDGKAELYNLSLLMEHSNVELPDAYMLIIRNPYPDLVDSLEDVMLCDEEKIDEDTNMVTGVEWDKKKVQYQREVNSIARYNLCFSDLGEDYYKEEANLQIKKGTVYNTRFIEPLNDLCGRIRELDVGELEVEGNFYYDLDKTYINFHRDKERRKVIGYRLGDSFPFHVRWHHDSVPVTEYATVMLEHGDMYFMTEFTCGFTRMKKTGLSIKHAAGYSPIIFKEKK